MADAAAPSVTKRFYEHAGIAEGEGGFTLTLDGRPARTPGRSRLALPTRALAEAVAAEWQAQGPSIDPTTMPLTRLANSTIDGVAPRLDEVREDLVRYAGSDLVVYRAAEPERLVAEQAAAWDPVHAWARDDLGAHFVLSEGVMFVEQPDEAVSAVRKEIVREPSAFALAGLHVMTTLTGSVLIALMQAAGRLSVEEAWRAAHADELFQESRWGQDHEASERRRLREAEFRSASRFVELARAA
jgi:chaperone required for assembly of F1-ATPase